MIAQGYILHDDVLGSAHPKYIDWFIRRQAAQRAGRPFNEPEPTAATLPKLFGGPPAPLSAEERHAARLLCITDEQALAARDAGKPEASALSLAEKRIADALGFGVTEQQALAARAVPVPNLKGVAAPAAVQAPAPVGELSEAEKICAKGFELSAEQALASRSIRPVRR